MFLKPPMPALSQSPFFYSVSLSLFFLPGHAVYSLIHPVHTDLNYGVPFLSLTAKEL